jgi:hypothetical protein
MARDSSDRPRRGRADRRAVGSRFGRSATVAVLLGGALAACSGPATFEPNAAPAASSDPAALEIWDLVSGDCVDVELEAELSTEPVAVSMLRRVDCTDPAAPFAVIEVVPGIAFEACRHSADQALISGTSARYQVVACLRALPGARTP